MRASLLVCFLAACGGSSQEPPPSALADAGSADAGPVGNAVVVHVGEAEGIVEAGTRKVFFSNPDGTLIGGLRDVPASGTVTLEAAPADVMVTGIWSALGGKYVTVTHVQPGDVVELDFPLHPLLQTHETPGGPTGELHVTGSHAVGDYRLFAQIGRCYRGERNITASQTSWDFDLGAGCAVDGKLDALFWVMDEDFDTVRFAGATDLGATGDTNLTLDWVDVGEKPFTVTGWTSPAEVKVFWAFHRAGVRFQSEQLGLPADSGTVAFDFLTAAPFADGVHVTLVEDAEDDASRTVRSAGALYANDDPFTLDAAALLPPAVELPERTDTGGRATITWQGAAARVPAEAVVVRVEGGIEWILLTPPDQTSVTTPILPATILGPDEGEVAVSVLDFPGIDGYASIRSSIGAYLPLFYTTGAVAPSEVDMTLRFSLAIRYPAD